MELPKYNRSSKKGEDGITIVKRIVEKQLNWIFRKNHQEHDFGIDAFIDIISGGRHITGKSIGLQLKTGASYFSEPVSNGWIYRDDVEHLNYYLNHDIPVIILLVDDTKEVAYWCACEASKTEKAGNNWKIIVPSKQILSIESKQDLLKYITPVRDYVSQLEHFWEENKAFKGAGRILFSVDKEFILSKEYEPLILGLQRLQVNDDLIQALKGKIDIGIDGYDDDNRELYEIPEVREWVNTIFDNVLGLSYFLSTDRSAHFLRVMQYVNMDYKILQDNIIKKNGLRGRKTEIDLTTGEPFLNKLWADLNEFCETYSMPLEVNKERTFSIVEYLTGQVVPDHLKK